jgi:formamidopyrimidine-DNA glycosylase
LRWREAGAPIPKKLGLLALDFDAGTLLLTEASPKKRAWVRVVDGEGALASLDPGGLEPLGLSREEFEARLRSENHTLKRALTDPRLFSGIGNAYSDEILHRARLSPVALTSRLAAAEAARLHAAVRDTLLEWTDRLRRDSADRFPEKVTAFRPEMAVHGKFGNPCPACGTPVQRIAYADHETNYCPTCQTGGRLLADRSLSRLLHDDWPKSLEEMEDRKEAGRGVRERRPSGA